uniref:Uncharacterized protein n=1 Tax=Picea glauca TaxID=3330 RepID=A0A124GPB0_PICGL|nr:hypothetical protein ABT39_MTgene1259 [Picea glauca]
MYVAPTTVTLQLGVMLQLRVIRKTHSDSPLFSSSRLTAKATN